MGNLWSDPDTEVSASDVTLLTRFEPNVGDIWASQNGNTVYIAGLKEQLQISGAIQKAIKVEAYEAGNLKGDGGDIIDQCFQFGLAQNQTNDPDSANSSASVLYLDPGCTDTFEHVRVGSEWWLGAVLVKETAEVTSIEITNYGYEWYELTILEQSVSDKYPRPKILQMRCCLLNTILSLQPVNLKSQSGLSRL